MGLPEILEEGGFLLKGSYQAGSAHLLGRTNPIMPESGASQRPPGLKESRFLLLKARGSVLFIPTLPLPSTLQACNRCSIIVY